MRTWIIAAIIIAIPCPTSRADIVAYWRFESGAANATATGAHSILDYSGNGLTGTPVNGPIYRSAIGVNPVPLSGETNARSLDFDGSNDRVFIPDYAALALTGSLTLEAYVFARSYNPSESVGSQILFRGDSRSGLDPYALSLNFDGTAQFLISNASNQQAYVRANMPGLNQWTHLAATLDVTTGTMRLYINGALQAEQATSIRPFATLDSGHSPGLGIGNTQSTDNQFFNGLIDEVRVSNTALAPHQFLSASVPELGSGLLMAFAVSTSGLFMRFRRRRGEVK